MKKPVSPEVAGRTPPGQVPVDRFPMQYQDSPQESQEN